MNEIHKGINKFYIGENEQDAVAEITYIPKGEAEYIVPHLCGRILAGPGRRAAFTR